MQDYEKLGAFYLGREFDLEADGLRDDLVLYDSRELTTHGVIVGMTGSGKTGLGIGLLEEAAIDGIPVIAIDPKGDLGNMLLTFPDLRPEDFRPWVDPQAAATRGQSPDQYAAAQAALWRTGLDQWGQGADRIRRLEAAAERTIYTPGSTAGRAISLLRGFAAPSAALREDGDLFRERVQATASSILGFLGIQADPMTSREHVLLATILETLWRQGKDLDLAGVINAIQHPPVTRLGVMDLDTVYPARDRFALAMQLNTLLASPGFAAWLEGDPLDASSLLFTTEGKPRVSILSIAHLSDQERMFFVSLLLSEILAWVRSQSGTSSLRALLYMDEVFGFLPPTANPPSKQPLMTLLKQARAFGVGVVLATQNPVDLDYKALSNAGTWWIGRLQTERDKQRLLDGLEGAGGGGFDRQQTGRILASLGKRVFLQHSVHSNEPTIFQTRWVLSYLAGPMTREQIRSLTPPSPSVSPAAPAAAIPEPPVTLPAQATAPHLPPDIPQVYLPCRRAGVQVHYRPLLLGAADLLFSSAPHSVQETRRVLHLTPVSDGAVPVDWAAATRAELDVAHLESQGVSGAGFATPAAPLVQSRNYAAWTKLYERYLRGNETLTLWRSPSLRVNSTPDEDERDFRIRLRQVAHERRDTAVDVLRRKYASRVQTLQNRLRTAEHTLEQRRTQATQRKLETAVSTGTAILGALFGRSVASVGTVSRAGTAIKSAGRMGRDSQNVATAQANAEALRTQLRELEEEVAREVQALEGAHDPLTEPLEEVRLSPRAGGITVHTVTLAWAPYIHDALGHLQPAW